MMSVIEVRITVKHWENDTDRQTQSTRSITRPSATYSKTNVVEIGPPSSETSNYPPEL